MKQTLFLLLALAVTLGLLTHALQERARLMAPTPAPHGEAPLFQKAAQNTTTTTILWEPRQPPLNTSQVTVEVDGKRMFFEDDGKDYVDMTYEMGGGR